MSLTSPFIGHLLTRAAPLDERSASEKPEDLDRRVIGTKHRLRSPFVAGFFHPFSIEMNQKQSGHIHSDQGRVSWPGNCLPSR